MAASTSTPTDPNSKSSFDVFLNHRGPDVKKTFASYLYRRLHSYGLKVFLDQQELQQGDYFTSQIEGAIRTASVHVAIFSVGYAESTWCLNELLLMLETNASIIPVFYKVKPTELRRTRGGNGVYAQALQKLEEKKTYDAETHQEKLRHDPETVEQWRNALSTVAGISGFEIDACNGDEGELLDKVVETVLKKVKKSPLNVAKYPTGLDEKVTDFENKVLLQHQQSGTKPQVVGIIGLGGLGKTTLSKELFNRKSTHYKRCCFLEDVRENVGKGSLVSLQRKLLKSLTGSDLQIDNKDEGIEKLKMHLSSSEILLILDDVDHVDQMDALLPDQTSIHSNSLILITSRNKDVFTTSVVQKLLIYKLNMLNKEHSLELFCCHAFSRPCPLPKFEHLTEKFVKACDGLPLSLKVFGALLHGNNDTSYWQKQLDKLEKILPSGMQERLRISYEALDKQEKQIFLDIACFFRGENRDTAIRIWNASGWEGSLGFRTLQNKCLVEVVEVTSWNNGIPMHEIHMHDHLRDLGRAEAHVSQPLRFWHIDDLLQQSSVITVRGIRMVLSEYDDDEEFDDIQMRRLQLVDTEGILLERILRRVKSPDLIWLCWKQCPYASLPSWIPMKKLRVLRLSHSTLKTLWQQESQLPICLEELRLHACHELKSKQGLAQLTKLHRLEFSECGRLEEVPSIETLVSLEALRIERGLWKRIRGLEQATKLKWLDLHRCLSLEKLSMETLVSLEVFEAHGCSKLKSIQELEHATKLQRIHVSGCTMLEELPSMERLVSLEVLEADGCVKLKSIQGWEQATKLRRIDVSRCPELEELPSIETLISLEELFAGECVKLKRIRGLEQATKLQHLNVSAFTLEELPSIETLVSLEALGCVKMKSTRGLEQATKLQRLNVSGCRELEELSSMEALVSFRGLWARACRKLKSIRGLEQATELQQIDVSFCTELEELPSMESLVSLEILSAVGCVKLKSIQGLEQATKLQRINVCGCTELEELSSMETLVSLEELMAERCVKLKSIQGLEQATKLEDINVRGCTELAELPSMAKLVSLKRLMAGGCVKLKSIGGFEQATKLECIDVSGCTELEKLPSIKSLVSLKGLLVGRCVKLKSIQGLEQATKLEVIDVRGCTELAELPSMATLVSLKQLSAEGCVKLKSVWGLDQATKLKRIDVNGCTELEELPNIKTLVSLRDLIAKGCGKLKSIQGLEQATKLLEINVSGCTELEELPSMATLVSLMKLSAEGCVKLKSIRGLEQCARLSYVSVKGCCELEEVEGVEHLKWLEYLDLSMCPRLQCGSSVKG